MNDPHGLALLNSRMHLLMLETRDENGAHDRPDKRLSGLPGLSWQNKSPAASPGKGVNGCRRLAIVAIHHTQCPQDMHRVNQYYLLFLK